MREVWEETRALPSLGGQHDVVQATGSGSESHVSRARSRNPIDASSSSQTRSWAHETQRLRGEFASMQEAVADWQRQLGGEPNYFARQQGESAQCAARVRQHEGR